MVEFGVPLRSNERSNLMEICLFINKIEYNTKLVNSDYAYV